MHSFCLPETAWEMTSQHGQICDGLVLPKDSCIHVHAFMWWPPKSSVTRSVNPCKRWSGIEVVHGRASDLVQENLERQKSDLTIHRLISRGNGLPDLAQQIWLGIYNDLYYVVKLCEIYIFFYISWKTWSVFCPATCIPQTYIVWMALKDAASGASGSWFLSPRFHP